MAVKEDGSKNLEPQLFRWLVLLLLAFLAVGVLTGVIPNPFFEEDLGEYTPWVIFGLVLLATMVLLNLFKHALLKALGQRMESEADIVTIYQLVSYLVWTVVIVGGIWAILGAGGMFAGLGAGLMGAALIYVLQEPLLNVVAWLGIMTQKLYRLGDRIQVKGVKGYVVRISIMNTTLREFDNWMDSGALTGRLVVMPNNVTLTDFIFNYTRDTQFINESVKVDFTYDSDLKSAERLLVQATEEEVGELMRENIEVIRQKYEFRDISDQTIEKIIDPIWRLEDSSVNMQMRFFVPAHRGSYFKTRIIKRLVELVAEEPKVSFAYPHVELVTKFDRPDPE